MGFGGPVNPRVGAGLLVALPPLRVQVEETHTCPVLVFEEFLD